MSALIEAIDFPSVIAAAHVDHLRSGQHTRECDEFVRSYLGVDDYARFALETLIGALGEGTRPGAFFLNGVFGSGKSHLLGIITLLGEGLAHEAFAETYPALQNYLGHMSRRLVVYFSLDEYDGAGLGLEEICQREIIRQAKRKGIEITAFAETESFSRSEQFVALEEELKGAGYQGLQLCVDELSLFLGAKDHRALQREASWLQFLGQRCARMDTHFSYRCCFVLQKRWEDVGDLEPYSLSQVRDRYETLMLSMAHVPALIEKRLVRRLDDEALHELNQQTFAKIAQKQPLLDFGFAEWNALYPFHPAAVQLLTEVTARFFSRTRSAVLFCAQALQGFVANAETAKRIYPEEVFDYFQPEFGGYVELRSLDRTWQSWLASLPQIARDTTEESLYKSLLKTMLLFRLSGRAVTAITLGNAIDTAIELKGEDYYRYIHQLLMRWSKEADHLSCDAGEDWREDQFAVNLGQSIKAAVRRLARHARETLQEKDARIVSYLLEMCSDASFPLQRLLARPLSIEIDWYNSPRSVELAFWNQPGAAQLINQLSQNEPGEAKVLLSLAMPAGQAEIPNLSALEKFEKSALLLWRPRQMTDDEWEFARESAARYLLKDDPILRDNRRGRSILRYLQGDLKQRAIDVQKLVRRLYAEGTLLCGDHRFAEVAELCHQREWEAMITALASFALEELYPHYPRVAPGVKVLSTAQVQQMGQRLLEQSAGDCWWPPSLQRPVRAIAAPLGLSDEDQGRRKFAPGSETITEALETFLNTQTLPLSRVIEFLAAPPCGLLPLQSELILCGMMGAGKMQALDASGKVLLASEIKTPLARTVHALRLASLMDATKWEHASAILALLNSEPAGELTFAAQVQAAERVRHWCEETRAELELAAVRLRQLQTLLDDAPVLWQQTQQTLQQINRYLEMFTADGNEMLWEAMSQIDIGQLTPRLDQWRTLRDFLDEHHRQIILILQRINHPNLFVSGELAQQKTRLQQSFAEGEKALFDIALLEQATVWNQNFEQNYRDWHQRQNELPLWKQLRELSVNPIVQALEKLGRVARYPYPEDGTIRAAIRDALRVQCHADGSLLSGEIACSHCRSHMEQKVLLPDIGAFRNRIQDAVQRLFDVLHRDEISRYLERQNPAAALLQWDGKDDTLPGALDDESLFLLEKSLQPRRRVHRSLQELCSKMGKGGTRAQLQKAFDKWLNDDGQISEDDEVIIEP